MLLFSHYDENTKVDKCWYQSSNICYSEFVEYPDANAGDLFVTFNNGATYKYINVNLTHDYIMFKHGSLDGSHGKALNAHIKPKYQFEKTENKNVEELIKTKEIIQTEQQEKLLEKTYFISGHRDIDENEFNIYKTAITNILNTVPDAYFIVGDYYGVDIMAQDFLIQQNVNPNNITVYHMLDNPRNINPNITNTIGGFKTDEERDAAMTKNSKYDIAFIRNHTKLSGTAQNILRRKLFENY